MALLATDYDRIKDAKMVEVWTNRFISSSSELDSIFINMENTRDKYDPASDEYGEINTKITQGKNLLQNMINNH